MSCRAAGGSAKTLNPKPKTLVVPRGGRQVQRCKAVIRECVRVCDEADGDGAIPPECYDENGELDESHILCSKCANTDSREVRGLETYRQTERQMDGWLLEEGHALLAFLLAWQIKTKALSDRRTGPANCAGQ
jgi:hypothetical protein